MSRRRSQRGSRGRRGRDGASSSRTARAASLIRRVVAEGLEEIGDERLAAVAVTGVDVDGDLQRAIVWYTTYDDDHDPDVQAALAELWPRLRHEVATRTRLRRAPLLEFRPDGVLRSAERIEHILAETAAAGRVDDRGEPGRDHDGDGHGEDGHDSSDRSWKHDAHDDDSRR